MAEGQPLDPVLVFAYARLARTEERDSIARFGDSYRRYMESTPAFIPHWHVDEQHASHSGE